MEDDQIKKAPPIETLRGTVQKFLNEFEKTGESENDMKTLFPLWKDKILDQAHGVGGGVEAQIKKLINVCEDYANNYGMIERIRKEAEETRLHLGL